MSAPGAFRPAVVGGMIAAGVAAFIAFLLLLAFGDGLGTGRDGRAHALSRSAVGFSGLVDLVGAFAETGLIRDPDDLGTEDLVIVTLETRNHADEVWDLLDFRVSQPTLLVLPKWRTIADPARPGWVHSAGPLAPQEIEPLLGDNYEIGRGADSGAGAAEGQDLLREIEAPLPEHHQTIAGEGLRPLLVDPSGGILLAEIDAQHYVLADPDLLNNHGLADPRTARAALRIVEALNSTGAEGVWFDLTSNGFAQASELNLLRLAFQPPFLAMTLALLAAALLAGLHGARRFGPVREEKRAIAFGKAALVENSAGLIHRAGRETALAGRYAELVREQAARASGAPRTLRGEALDTYLNRFSPPGEPTFSELAARLHLIHGRDDLVAAARALFRWKKEIVR